MGTRSEPDSDDYRLVAEVFDQALNEIGAAGASLVELPEIPELNERLAKRALERLDEVWDNYFLRNTNLPYPSRSAMRESPDFSKVRLPRFPGVDMAGPEGYGEYLRTRDDLMFDVMQLMAESQLDAIVHRTVEHQPTLISEGVGPPYYNGRGVTHINTFLAYVPSISVPAGFTSDGLPVGITFLARPFNDGAVIKLAYAYEQATRHRRPPTIAPPLPGEP